MIDEEGGRIMVDFEIEKPTEPNVGLKIWSVLAGCLVFVALGIIHICGVHIARGEVHNQSSSQPPQE